MVRLLLVEDEYIEREAMKHVISQRFKESFEIKEADNGLEAVELARSFKPQIIFLDIKMPGCSGIEAAKKIREFLPEAHMIFITAYDYFDYAKEAISLGVDEFLLKPVDIDEVGSYIEKVMKKLQVEQLKHTQTEKVEYEFSVIKKKYELEFKELLLDEQASESQINHYLEIMDLQMKQALVGLIDFTTIEQYETISSIQKEFIKERFGSKLTLKCQMNGIAVIIGDLKDLLTVIFILPDENPELLALLKTEMNECSKMMGMPITYQLSAPIYQSRDLPKLLYTEKERFFTTNQKLKKTYPYALEDEIVEWVRKKEFEAAETSLRKLTEDLMSECEFAEFKKEIQGLYTLIERTMRRSAPELLLQGADRLANEVASYGDLINFYHRFFDYAKSTLAQTPDKNQVLIQKMAAYLEKHYNEDLSLEEAASMIGFSSFYFTKLMKEHMGLSYVDYMTMLRVKKAKELLETTDLTVKDVGIAVGYDNANYFTRVFKRVEGKAPSQYKTKLSD